MSQVSTGEVEWRCFNCGSCNWSGNRMCTTCEKWRDQDWSCVMCGYKNFAKRDTCKECGAGHVPEYNQEAGTYQNFHQVQLSGYQDPYSVPAAESSYSKVPPVPEPQECGGELPWLCGMCNAENTPKRILCFECSGHRERVEIRNRAAENRPVNHGGPGLRQSSSLSYPTRDFTPDREPLRVQYQTGGTGEDQTLDWHCSNCDNRNFAKRSKCNKCSKPRSEVERKNSSSWASLGSLDYISPYPRGANRRSSESRPPPQPFMSSSPGERAEDKSNDWSCTKCDNRNFAKRKECNRCKLPRAEVEDKAITFSNDDPPSLKRGPESLMLNHAKHLRQTNDGPRNEDLTNDWVCGKCNINCFAKKASCFRCGKSRSEVETRNVDVRQFERPLINYPSTPRSQPISLSGHNLTLRTSTPSRFRTPPRPGPLEKPKRKWVDEDKSKDWHCKKCYINNFAKRKSCFQCKKSRSEVEADATEGEATEVSVDEAPDTVVMKND